MPEDLEARLERLTAPPAGVDFHSELWERIRARERAFRRRRRTVLAIGAAAAIVTASAAGVFAFGEQTRPLDKTLSCPVPEVGGVNRLDLNAHVKAPPTHFGDKAVPSPAQAIIQAGILGGPQQQYAGVTSVRGGFLFDQTICRNAPAIPLERAGLPAAGVYRGTTGAGITRECWLAPTVAIRLRVTLGASGTPVEARLAVRSGKKLRPVLYVEWTPTLIREYASSSCQVR
jgi:hypothetical protein